MSKSLRGTLLTAIVILTCFSIAPACRAQGANGPVSNTLTGMDAGQANHDLVDSYMQQTLGDPKEESAYRAFHKVPIKDADKKIKLGEAFIGKYPSDRYTQAVYDELAQTFYAKRDVPGFYDCADQGLAKFPDDVTLLALAGWVIPRAYQPADPEGDKKLDKAEAYEKRAIEVMASLQKPPGASDQEFAQYKTDESSVAHSALGLVYFRKEQYVESAKELQQSLVGVANPDPTDLLVLGADLQNMSRFKDAADAFNRCAQIAGSFQEQCKQQAANSLKMAAQSN